MALQIPGAALFYMIVAIVILSSLLVIFVPRAKASGEKIVNLPFFGGGSQGESGSLDEGYKALHVKINPATSGTLSSSPLQIYEFHLTNQGALGTTHYSDYAEDPGVSETNQYFSINNWKDNKCALFTTLVTPQPTLKVNPFDNDYVYYIDSGTIVSPDVSKNQNLKSAIDGRYERGCKTIECGGFNAGDYTVCAKGCGSFCQTRYDFKCSESASDKVIEQTFGSGDNRCSADTIGCPSNGCCPLLKDNPSENYKLVAGLMCGYSESDIASAKWWTCTQQNNGMSVYTGIKGEAGAIQYKCSNGEWISAADQGISLENPEIKYDSTVGGSIAGDYYTGLRFYLANHNTAPIKDVSIKADIDASAADCSKLDSTQLVTDKTKDSGWGEVSAGKLFDSEDLRTYVANKFCNSAKKFSVEADYTYNGKSLTDKFDITCNPASASADGVWQKNVCTASLVSGTQTTNVGSAAGTECTGGTYACRSESACTNPNIGGAVDKTKKCGIEGTVCCTK